ncbi:hypothetical protein Patl1_26430 [Pistacia atlantica]|uniref:Uncharacterized protein n=1 Tax=Pistacia atlantica TaxID=434234 RepID=A0ACC1B1K2_9ROSI|nr:hypothetical protein Patl1_26430 [Pistacia atlantica]
MQQQQQHMQEQQQKQQQTGELKIRGPVPSPNHKDNASDVNPSAAKD